MAEDTARICKEIPSSVLDKCVHVSFLDEIARDLVEWEVLAPAISLTRSEQREIEENYHKQYYLQKREALRKWRKKLKSAATIRSLIRILCEQKLADIAEIIALKCEEPPVCISVFAGYLREFYIRKFSHPITGQWPGLHIHFDLPPVYVDLKLHEVPMGQSESSTAREVQLSDVFQNTSNRLVVLFEGVAGSGKTTLSWHACQEWANKKLLMQFRLLIHVQIARLQNVRALCDLIPDPDKEVCDELTQAIMDTRGKGICFIFEGIDEASSGLWDFILSGLLYNKDLPQLSYIFTSRPDGRLFKLQRGLTSKIVIDGFTYQTLNEFLDSAVPSDRFEEAKLVVEKSPQLQTLCTLPINAVIVSFLIQCYKDEIPVTQTKLFNLLFCHICIRHIQLRERDKPIKIKHVPDNLPSDLRKPFDKLCLLAFTALREKKKVFSSDDLQDKIEDKLGILQLHQTFTMYGLEEYYSFPHLALQQFLAAIHLSQLQIVEQKNFVQKLIKVDPLDELLAFHAGLTSDEICTFVVEHLNCNISLDDDSVASKLVENPTESNDPRRKTLALFKCLYECQNESLLGMVQLQIETISRDPGIDLRYVISFWNMWLSPIECLAIGYFVRYKSITLPERRSLSLNLGHCSISDTSVRVLTRELKREINYRTPGRVILLLGKNRLSCETLVSVKELLKGPSNIEGLALQKCFISKEMDKRVVLKHIIEGLNCSSSCRHIAIGYNDLNQTHAHHLVLMLMSCRQLCILSLTSSSITSAMPLLSRAFFLSELVALHLNRCDIDDKALVPLAAEISKNQFLQSLEIYGNLEITPKGLYHFVSFFVNKTSNLIELVIDTHLDWLIKYERNFQEIERVNSIRKSLNRPELHVVPRQPIRAAGWSFLDELHSLSRKQGDDVNDNDDSSLHNIICIQMLTHLFEQILSYSTHNN